MAKRESLTDQVCSNCAATCLAFFYTITSSSCAPLSPDKTLNRSVVITIEADKRRARRVGRLRRSQENRPDGRAGDKDLGSKWIVGSDKVLKPLSQFIVFLHGY